jgi:bifunctional DNase/RNase
MQEMELLGVRVELPSNAPMLLLRETTGQGRTVPIFIGTPEATAIALALDGVETPRPMTHDLLVGVVEALGAEIDRVVIIDLHDKTFFAELHLLPIGGDAVGGEPRVVQCRPSDAAAIAVRVGAPIYCADDVIDDAGFSEDLDEMPDADRGDGVVEEFKEFLDSISPEDFED